VGFAASRFGLFQDPIVFFIGVLVLIVMFFSAAGLYNAADRRHHPGPRGPAEPWHRWEPGSPLPARPTAHDILRERRARGEVNAEDCDELMAALGPDPYGLDSA
jgi:hypothetical protein